jgi:hypothetical protein
VNYLATGMTAVQPDRWYHFAMVYDGTLIKWYLDGNLEGQLTAVNFVTPGSGIISIGNNRLSGTSDRGFHGMLDEVRISDQALSPANFLLNGGSCDAACGATNSVLWCSGFEAEPDAPVVHEQPEPGVCGAIENLHGRGGTAIGATAAYYVEYDQPGVGSAPGDEAGTFALTLPDDRSGGIDTHLASNSRRLNEAVTFEGFFNSAETAPILNPESVGQRLISQKRNSDLDTRLAIGLHADGGSNVLSVMWKNSGGVTYVAHGATAIVPGVWCHFALVYDGTRLKWYLDGNPQGVINDADLIDAGTASIIIGNRRSDGLADRGFNGLIDEVRIIDEALTPNHLLIGSGADDVDNPCLPTCSLPFADADGDGDVDQADFGIFQTCFTTTGELLPLPGCHCFDRAGDETIDAEDLEEFMNCATGPGIPWEQALTPLCIP